MPTKVPGFLQAHKDAILRSWEKRVTSEGRDVALVGLALRDDIPELLDELVALLASDAAPETSPLAALALKHVMQRLDEGVALTQVFREYRLLRETILRYVLGAEADEQQRAGAFGEGARDARVEELARLNAGLDVVLSQSVDRFVTERDHRAAGERARAEAALRESERRLASELEATQRLQETSTQLIREDNVEALYGAILDAAVYIMDSDCGSIQLLHPERGSCGELHLLGHRGFSPEAATFWEWVRPESASTCGIALRTRQRVLAPDVLTCDFMAGSADLKAYLEAGIRAVQTTPLVSRSGRLLGMISTHWAKRHQPSEHALELLDVLARQAADLIERAQAQEALRQREESLREADRHKNEFIAALSHELRNPLAPIRNSLYILDRATPGGEQARRAQTVIDRQSQHMSRLIDDLLDVTRITRGKIQLQRERLDLDAVVLRTLEDHQSTFEKAGVELMGSAAGRPVWVHGDRTRLAQAVGNLLQNSARFTPAGGKAIVSVSAEVGAGEAVIEVRDTGRGIDESELRHLFEPFTQADKTLDRSMGGLGLGLSLVKGLVELHGGTVTALSEGKDRGATFTVRLPLATAAVLDGVTDPAQAGSSSRRILVVEDNPDAASSLKDVLELQGHLAAVASSGEDSLELARHFFPEIVLCDIGLPDMDGYAVARALRAEFGRALTLVALSGYAQPEDVQRSRDAGFDTHLAKPVEFEVLADLLARLPTLRMAAAGA